jgi:hypothetical protein
MAINNIVRRNSGGNHQFGLILGECRREGGSQAVHDLIDREVSARLCDLYLEME